MIVVLTAFCVYSTKVDAQMQSPLYKFDQSIIEVSPEEDSASISTIAQTFGALATRQFLRQGYVVREGFVESTQVSPKLSFTVLNTNIIFSNLVPRRSIQEKIQLVIHSTNTPYQIAVGQEKALEAGSGAIIESTKCDGGKNFCLGEKPARWESSNSYGFGFSTDEQYYRPFADIQLGDKPNKIFSGVNNNPIQKVVTLKLHIGPKQEKGSYQTILHFIAAPGY